MGERWVKLKQFDSAYEVSDLGNLRSIERIDASGKKRRGQPIKQRVTKKYYCSNIRVNKVSITIRPHRLVAQMFVPNPNNYPLVNHIDGDTFNNAYWNLEWTDHIGNTIHAIRNRLTRKPGGKEKTLTENQALSIFKSKKTTAYLSSRYGVCIHTINCIRNGIKWSWLTGKRYVSKNGGRKHVSHKGRILTYGELAKELNISRGAVTYRIKQGLYNTI